MNITVSGMGYVGISNAILLAQTNKVVAFDIDEKKISQLLEKQSPIKSNLIGEYLKKSILLTPTTNERLAYEKADFILISTPTNYDEDTKYFDISSIEKVVETALKFNTEVTFIIKSTIPINCINQLIQKFNYENFVFCPEFLREDSALEDLLSPSRIIFGFNQNNEKLAQKVKIFSEVLIQNIHYKSVPILYMNTIEAEAIKLFSNSYLAMRTSFFNEIDTYAEINNLNTKDIIDGVCLDPRIGTFYNNPSFGYGGYCLPKDTKQLMANYNNIPENLISAIVASNTTRKEFIIDSILNQISKIENPTIGIYRLTMKANSDNFRQAAIQDIIEGLKHKGVSIIVYEPILKAESWNDYLIENDLEQFKLKSSLIVANRYANELDDVINKVYTRDLYLRN